MTQASNSMSMMMSCTFEVKWPQLVQGQPQQQAQGQSQQPVQGQSQQLGQVQSHPQLIIKGIPVSKFMLNLQLVPQWILSIAMITEWTKKAFLIG